jgi:hypothetical protein
MIYDIVSTGSLLCESREQKGSRITRTSAADAA